MPGCVFVFLVFDDPPERLDDFELEELFFFERDVVVVATVVGS